MIASETTKTQVLAEPAVECKLMALEAALSQLLRGGHLAIPDDPGRDVQIWPIRELPKKKGLSAREGQARLLHDLASIELQAMELGVRTLAEFPEAPKEFRAELAAIARDEGRHLRLCLEALQDLKFPWGSFPTHVGLWQAVAREDSLLDRVLIVHRYLEGSGLDASNTILQRLTGVRAPEVKRVVEVIACDEVAHVKFGSHWYRHLARQAGHDPESDFRTRLAHLAERIPRRMEPIRRDLRLTCGFSEAEIEALEEVRLRRLSSPAD